MIWEEILFLQLSLQKKILMMKYSCQEQSIFFSNLRFSFKFIKRQFSTFLNYIITINKS